MKVSLELLFHYRCDNCDRWWSIADIPPKPATICPHCGTTNKVEDTQYHLSGNLSTEEIQALSELLSNAHLRVKESAGILRDQANDQYVESLKTELARFRETNRRLNRRCQELESQILVESRRYDAASKDLINQCARFRRYANDLRDEWRRTKSSIHASYQKHWERLPKPLTGHDGIRARVDEALRTIDLLRKELERVLDEPR
jgi:chromosome segregation ATPase